MGRPFAENRRLEGGWCRRAGTRQADQNFSSSGNALAAASVSGGKARLSNR